MAETTKYNIAQVERFTYLECQKFEFFRYNFSVLNFFKSTENMKSWEMFMLARVCSFEV